MGQVCTKTKPDTYKVYPEPTLPLGSLNRTVKAFESPAVCQRIDITRYKLSSLAFPFSAKNLVCDFSGGAGCFVCDLKNIEGLLLHPKTQLMSVPPSRDVSRALSVSSSPSASVKKNRLDNQKLYDFIQSPTNGVCVKIFFNTDFSSINYNKEADSYTILKDLAGADAATAITTYAEYDGTHAFIVKFNSDSYDVYINGKPVKQLRCLLMKKCNESLDRTLRDPTKRRNLPVMEMVYNIGCILHMLHQNGYIHADIKPENIVVCEQEPIRYKLIDYALKKYTQLETPNAYTMQFLLPTLYQEITHMKSLNAAWETKKNNTYTKILQLTASYNPHQHQAFLIRMSLNAFKEADLTPMKSSGDYSLLYLKSDEYALAMTILEVLDIKTDTEFSTASKEVQTLIKKLIAKEPYFKYTPLEQCKAMATRLMTARSATIGSAFASKSARDGGARSGNKRNMNRRRS